MNVLRCVYVVRSLWNSWQGLSPWPILCMQLVFHVCASSRKFRTVVAACVVNWW